MLLIQLLTVARVVIQHVQLLVAELVTYFKERKLKVLQFQNFKKSVTNLKI